MRIADGEIRSEKFLLATVLLLAMELFGPGRVNAVEIGDITIQTDHGDYPGEGAFQTPEDCVAWATRGCRNDHERAIAIFKWLLKHQWHLMSPQEWCQPDRQPGHKNTDYEMVVYDANRGRFSYGYGLCGTVHAWNEAYWQAAGFPARRRAFPGHSNSEVFVDGRWRMFDTDMAGIVLNDDGSVAGYDEIIRDTSLLTRQKSSLPLYPFAWPEDFRTMQRGWEQVAAGGDWYALYHGGYAGQPGVVHLRSGETLTRFAHPDGFGDVSKRRFWHQQKDGPFRVWTFANQDEPYHKEDDSNCRGRTRYGNALFEYRPPLSDDLWQEGVVRSSSGISTKEGRLINSSSKEATVIFEHFSPYVICGDPIDDTDPMLGRCTDGMVVQGEASGRVLVSISSDQGQSWSSDETLTDRFRMDWTEQVKGHYGWWVRCRFAPGASIASLQFATTGQMCESIYPRLSENGSEVTIRAGGRAVVPVLPRLADETATTNRFEHAALRSSNVKFAGRSAEQRFAYRSSGREAGQIVFRIPARTELVGISAAARYGLRVPTPEGARFQLEYSVDEGRNWSSLGESTPPVDNEFSSGWVYGASEVDHRQPSNEALVRVSLSGGGYPTGLITTELYGLRRTAASSAATVTWSWFEGEQSRTHTADLPAGSDSHVEYIETGQQVRDDFVRITVD